MRVKVSICSNINVAFDDSLYWYWLTYAFNIFFTLVLRIACVPKLMELLVFTVAVVHDENGFLFWIQLSEGMSLTDSTPSLQQTELSKGTWKKHVPFVHTRRISFQKTILKNFLTFFRFLDRRIYTVKRKT